MRNIFGFIIIALALCYFLRTPLYAANGFTQKDREILIELKMKAGEIDRRFEQIDKRFEQVDKRFEQVDKRFEQVDKRSDGIERRLERLESGMMWGFGLLFSSMLGMVGFVLWDRRSALAPAIRKSRELEEREDMIEKALKEYAKIEPRFAEILKTLKM
ncbi:MAG: hypothetical protein HY037_06475 [Nitrospirae bacterium]|nr:hypothetical protein [Candidatus Troglogloeales bacterium]